MKKYKKILLIFVICLIGLGILAFLNREMGWVTKAPWSESKPEWIVLGSYNGNEGILSLNVESITKIQKEEVDKNIRVNSSAPIKRDVYSAWEKIEPKNVNSNFWERMSRDGDKVHYVMVRNFVDLANRESAVVQITLYYETGTSDTQTSYPEWEGVIPNTSGESLFKALVKYK